MLLLHRTTRRSPDTALSRLLGSVAQSTTLVTGCGVGGSDDDGSNDVDLAGGAVLLASEPTVWIGSAGSCLEVGATAVGIDVVIPVALVVSLNAVAFVSSERAEVHPTATRTAAMTRARCRRPTDLLKKVQIEG
jgi:hypothetical protein